MRVCQFRHDGKWTSITAAERRRIRKTCFSILQARKNLSNLSPRIAPLTKVRKQGLIEQLGYQIVEEE